MDLLLVAVEFGDAKARCGEGGQQDVVHIQIGPFFEIWLCLVGGYEKVDAIQPRLSAFMPGNKCGRRVKRKPCGCWFLFDHLRDPVPPVQDILVDELFFDIVQGQITNGTTGIYGQSPAQQKQHQEKCSHGSPLQFVSKPTGRGGIKKAPLITGHMENNLCHKRKKGTFEISDNRLTYCWYRSLEGGVCN